MKGKLIEHAQRVAFPAPWARVKRAKTNGFFSFRVPACRQAGKIPRCLPRGDSIPFEQLIQILMGFYKNRKSIGPLQLIFYYPKGLVGKLFSLNRKKSILGP